MLILMSLSLSKPVKAWLVNWLPWSVFMICGLPNSEDRPPDQRQIRPLKEVPDIRRM